MDALYVGVDSDGSLYAIPIEAKSQGENELFGRVQVANMAKLVRQVFPELKRRILGVKPLPDGTIGIIEFSDDEEPDDFGLKRVVRYRLIYRDKTDVVFPKRVVRQRPKALEAPTTEQSAQQPDLGL